MHEDKKIEVMNTAQFIDSMHCRVSPLSYTSNKTKTKTILP